MTPSHDPYRVLGLARGATLDEVKRAYRRLAKQLHPDSGGERTLARFLEIQAAYEQLAGGPAEGRPAGRSSPGYSAPWQADTDRADATRRAYGARPRGTRARPTSGADGRPPSERPGRATERDAPGPEGRPGRGSRRERDRRKATLGSTSYDDADTEAFDPDWSGASWYGTTSGTYWTINPREYADPRKHGPEYQARARRGAGAEGGEAAPEMEPDVDIDADAPPIASDEDVVAPDAGSGARPPGWRPAAETAAGTDWSAAPGGRRDSTSPHGAPGTPGDRRPPRMTGTDGPPFDPGMVIPGIARTLDPRTERSVTGRLALALAGGLPIGIAVGWLLGELTGCGRFAATCDPGVVSLAWVVTFVVIAALVLVPSVAAIAAFGALGALLAGVPATVLLTVTGGSRMPDASAAVLGVILIVGWLAGVAAGTNRLRRRPAGPGPVS